MVRAILLTAVLLALGACSNGESDAQKEAAAAQAKAADKTVLDAQLKALQKAKDVQKTVDDQAKAADKAIDDQGG